MASVKKRSTRRNNIERGLMLVEGIESQQPGSDREQNAKEATLTHAVDQFCEKYGINMHFKDRLRQLHEYKVVLIADDSGSMRATSDAKIEGVVSRWDELQLMCGLLIELYAPFNDGGLDVHFLNRDAVLNVKSPKDKRLAKSFKESPSGATPICSVLKTLLDNATSLPRIIVIATDGMPTAPDGRTPQVNLLKQMLNDRDADQNYVSIVACTGDDSVLSYLNRWDVEIRNLDVVDDFLSERQEVLRAQGRDFGFNYADYVIKLLLGSIDSYFDRLDEMTAARRAQIGETSGCNCTLL